MHYPAFSFSVHIFQCTVDLLHLRRQHRKLSANIRGDLFLAMNALVLLYMVSHFLGNRVMVSEQAAKERRKFVAMLRSSCFHRRWFLEKSIGSRNGASKNAYIG